MVLARAALSANLLIDGPHRRFAMSEPKLIILDDAPSLHVHAAEEIAHFAGEAICMHTEWKLGQLTKLSSDGRRDFR
jgi:hypothetical protein